ncbi:MAG: stalk domain-containing protein [Hominilimicola sp.]
MFRKDQIKGFIIGVIAAVSAGTMVTALAEPVEQAISVVFDNYRIIIDGADKSNAPDDSKPFIYNGRTYVPLRYIGESMGKKVLWDGDTKSIYINDEGTQREDVYFSAIGYDKIDTDRYTDNENSAGHIYLDNETKTVYLSSTNHHSQHIKSDWRYSSSIIYNLNGIAKNVMGSVDMSGTDEAATEGKVVFYDQNDRILCEMPTMRNSTEPTPFEFDVSGVLQLRVEFISSGDGSYNSTNKINIKDFRYSK